MASAISGCYQCLNTSSVPDVSRFGISVSKETPRFDNVGAHEQASFCAFLQVGVYNTSIQKEPSFVKMCLIYSSRRPERTNRTI